MTFTNETETDGPGVRLRKARQGGLRHGNPTSDQPGFFAVLLLLVAAEKEDTLCAGFGFSFFGLRFSRLLRCSLLAMGNPPL